MEFTRSPRWLSKETVKSVCNLCALVLTAPFWAMARAQTATTGIEGWFAFGAELFSMIPGKIGIYIRRGYYRRCLDECPDDVHIGFGTTIAHPQVRVGRRVYIGNRCTIGKVVLEDNVTVGSNVDILSGRRQHDFHDLERHVLEQGGSFEQIRIGCSSWICNSAVIMAEVGDNCVIGAGSVVVKPIPPCAVAVGNPARVTRTRIPSVSEERLELVATSRNGMSGKTKIHENQA
jgi:virginiamycin A acetyltransferase